MARLRLKNPSVAEQIPQHEGFVDVDVAVDAPLPHLDGEYTYLAHEGSVKLGSLVKVPFGSGETFGFVTRLGARRNFDGSLKKIGTVLVSIELMDESALRRYRAICNRYGGSLISILKLAIPMRRSMRLPQADVVGPSSTVRASTTDLRYLQKLFVGIDLKKKENNLLLSPGILWDHVAVSLFLADPVRTAIMVPTERDLSFLTESLRERGVTDFLSFSSGHRESERLSQFLGVLNKSTMLAIGNRSIAYLPTAFDRVIIIDPGHSSYQELRAPYFRSDESELWDCSIVRISHTRDLSILAKGQEYVVGSGTKRIQFLNTSKSSLISDLQRAIHSKKNVKSILISINDRSFASGLHCGKCKNPSSCICGFPLRIGQRGESPSCSKCYRAYPEYRCKYCHSTELTASRAGNQSWALTIAKSIKGARVLLSDSGSDKREINSSASGITIVIATQGLEPRVHDENGNYQGFDVVALLGAYAGFNSPSLTRADQYRRSWARITGLVNPGGSSVLTDLDRSHVEFEELSRIGRKGGIENLLPERRSLMLPPFSLLLEIDGDYRTLLRLRSSLLEDPLFQNPTSEIFPPHGETMVVKVPIDQRDELVKLLLNVVKLRSARRLSPIRFKVSPEHL